MQFEEAYAFLIEKLEKELPAHITYHDVQHTIDVLSAVEKIGEAEGLSRQQLELLCTASLFHDAGFLETYDNHEEVSCDIARRYLPQFDYTNDEIEEVCKLIMVTKVPQSPTNLLEQILCDADLFYLGTDLYFKNADKLYTELNETGRPLSPKEWQKKQVAFLASHRYFTHTAIDAYRKKKQENLELLKTNYDPHKEMFKHKLQSGLQDAFYIVLGVVTAGFALNGFLVPNHFFDGGVTGMSLLMHELYDFNLGFTIVLANLPLIVVSYFNVSKTFAFKTLASVVLLGICLYFIHYPDLTHDKLLIAIFGGFFLGAGIGLTMRAGSALDGVEVLALYTLKRTSFTITEIILFLNVLIFIIAAFAVNLETALYSILTYFTASRTIDYVIEGIEAYTGVTIISGQSELIKHRLVNEMGRGITVYKGERGYLPGKFEISSDCDIIFTVITRLELRKLKNVVYETDPKAFVFANTIKEASGGIVKRRHTH